MQGDAYFVAEFYIDTSDAGVENHTLISITQEVDKIDLPTANFVLKSK